MPAGELYIKHHSGMTGIVNAARFSYSNGTFTQSNSGQWIDTFIQWGVSLSETALSALMAPAPNKAPIENKSRREHGKSVLTESTLVKKDERELSLEMHITANSINNFWSKYDHFCDNVLDYGFLELINGHRPTKVFRLTYENCTQFSEFMEHMAKFSLRVNEPNPKDRAI